MRVSEKSTLSPVGMPFARKSLIFGLHSLLLRYPKKIYALSAYFFRPRRHNKLFYSATGGNRLLSSANTTPVPLKNRLPSGFSLTRCFSAAPVAGKQNAAIRRKKSNFRFIDRLRTALPYAAELSCCFFYKAGAFYFLKKRRIYCIIKRYKFFLKGEE